MTWEEFKATVENAGVKDADEIDYINIGMFDYIDMHSGPD